MTPNQIATARALVALGLPVPAYRPHYAGGVHGLDCGHVIPGATCEFGRLLFVCVVTDTGPELLPTLDDWALLGWLIAELERETGSTVEMVSTEDGWIILIDGQHNGISHQETRIEALTAVLKAAKEAGK